MAGGSHNRNTNKSLEHVLSSKGKMKLCKCPLHRNNGAGTLVEQIKFKRHNEQNVQGMCAEGKTLIDSYSHTLKRYQLLALVNYKELVKILNFAPKYYKPICEKIKSIIDESVKLQPKEKLDLNTLNLFKLTTLDKNLKTKETGFYDINLSALKKHEFNSYLQNCLNDTLLNEMQLVQNKWTKGCFILDSKDKILYPISEFGFNVSKKRELYDSNKKLTPYKVHVHNTRAKGQRSSTLRAEKYLACGAYTEANRYMKEISKQNKEIHADHIIPLALGGIHDKKNLSPLKGTLNIEKKDKLTIKALALLKKDETYLSKWHRDVFIKNKNEPIQLIYELLKNSVFEFRKKVINLNETDKIKFVSSVYPNYKQTQIERIIKKHFTALVD